MWPPAASVPRRASTFRSRRQAAEQKAITDIGIARANRDSAQQVAEANKLAEIARITATQEVADAQKDLSLKQAKNQQEVKTAEAITDQSYKLQELEVAQQLTQKEAAVQITRTERNAEVADRERVLVQKQLTVSVEEPALADKRKQQILAEAKVLEAEQVAKALMVKREAEGTAEARYAQTVAGAKAEANRVEGGAQAEVLQITGAAEADRIKTKGLAEAEIDRSQGIAKADVEKAMAEALRIKGLADAEVTEKVGMAQATVVREKGLAEAAALKAGRLAEVEAEKLRMQMLSETMTDKMLTYHLIQKMPEIISAFADVFPKFERVTLVDMGGQGGGVGAVDRFSGSMVRLLGTLVPMVENMTGVEMSKAMVGAFRSQEGQKAAQAAEIDEQTIDQVIETLRFPGGLAVPIQEVQQALDAPSGAA